MANQSPQHPTERAAEGARRRMVRKKKTRERAVWSLLTLIIALLITAVVMFVGRGKDPIDVDEQSVAQSSAAPMAAPAPTAQTEIQAKPTVVTVNKPILIEAAPKPKPTAPHPERTIVEIAPPAEPIAQRAIVPPTPDEKQPPPRVEQPQKPRIKLIDASFLSTPLPVVPRGAAAPGRPIAVLEFPRTPEQLELSLIGLEHLGQPGIESEFSAADQTLNIRFAESQVELATFYVHQRELRFRWKPRVSSSAAQRQIRDHCVLHARWKGHPGRYYALHDLHARSARRVRDQQVRLRSGELPSGVEPDNLYLGSGKLSIADIYEHSFLVTPLSQRVEVPTMTQSSKDPRVFVKSVWQDGSLALVLDAPVNTESEAKRRRKLFEHVDGNFYMHASLYRVVDNRIKVEVLRLGEP